jgi:gliding motility-associated-like protein
MNKLVSILVALLTICKVSTAQNLVKNPDFEQYKTCPLSTSWFNKCVVDWYAFLDGDASYFNTCGISPGTSVPLNVFGSQYALSGSGYGCIMVYSWDFDPDRRMYIEGSFSEPLSADTIYCISYNVSLADISLGAIQNVDALLSDTLMDWNNGLLFYLKNAIPQIKSPTMLTDSIGWTRISGLYKAHGGERYITLGNFLSNANTKIKKYADAVRVDYYIDDVGVEQAGMGLKAPDLGADITICRSALPIHLSAPTGYDAYLWNNGATTRETDATDQGKYWVKCIINGCGELYDEKIISFDTPLLELGKDTVICKGETIVIPAQPGFSKYLWSSGDTTQSIAVASAGIYSLTTIDRCGQQTDSLRVAIDSIPSGLIELGNDTTMCWYGTESPVIITSNTQLPNYFWNTGDTSAAITVTERGMYTLRSRFRCGDVTDSIFVNQCPPAIFFPNAFTPDNDGLNDVFRAITINTQVELMIIYNRWGQKIYESNDLFPEWDGTANKEASPNGLYAYVVYYSDAESGFAKKEKRGTVMLIR